MVTTKEMLRKAQRGKYAVGAFNIENAEMAAGVIKAAAQLRAPVILQTTSSTLRYMPPEVYSGIVHALAASVPIPVAMHLDHGSSEEIALRCLDAEYSSVMIDGSMLPFEENVQTTKKVVATAHAAGIPVEAELGKVGGKEDDLTADENVYTDPEQALDFTKRTGVDSLAVSIGTAHGFYAGTPVLDVKRLSEIRACVDIPLVLHGASGLSDDDIRDCVARGICKVNFATELRAAYTQGVRDALAADAGLYDPKKFGEAAMTRITALAMDRIRTCGADGKA